MASDDQESTPDQEIRQLAVVALLTELPEHSLRRGQVGTVVQELDGESFEVEFSDDEGRTYAQLPLRRDQLIVLHHRPHEAA